MKHTDCTHVATREARAACRRLITSRSDRQLDPKPYTRDDNPRPMRTPEEGCICAAPYIDSSWHSAECPAVDIALYGQVIEDWNLTTRIHPEVQGRWVNMTTDSGLVMCAINGRDVLHVSYVNGPDEQLMPLCGGSRRQSTYTRRDRAQGLVAQDKLCAGCNRHLTRLEINEQVSARHALRTLEQSMIDLAVRQRPSLP